MDPKHPTDCALCPLDLPGAHVYVDADTQARRLAAAHATNARIRAAHEAIAVRKANAR
jgi:hypothetical protein